MKKQRKSNPKVGVIVWGAVTAVVLAILIVLTVLENGLLKPIIGTVLGGPKPILDESVEAIYNSEHNSKRESKEAGDELNVEIAQEGFTLLVNEDHALPIPTPESDSSVHDRPRVSVFGKNSVNLVLGGSGSGGIGGESAATLFDGLTAGGYDFNPTLKAFYENNGRSGSGRSSNPRTTSGEDKAPTLDIGETPMNRYTEEVRASYEEYDDAAIVVISRLGGESFDLPRSQNTSAGGIEDNHYLQLDANEYALLDMVTSKFEKVIVVLNTLTSFQCDFIAQYNNTETDKRIDAVLWIGGPGSTGAKAFGDVLSGKVNPSGRTVDIYSKDFSKDPVWQNFGDNTQVNEDGSNGSYFLSGGSNIAGQFMVAYNEGIYVGYRYYETRGYEELRTNPASTWYDDNVIFPFGYGLSYTEFSQEIVSIEGNLDNLDSTVTIKVRSVNNGDRAGKDVIQLYVNKPYKRGGIEKSYVELVDFAKTPVLAHGEDYTATFVVKAYDLASYDYNDANGNGFKGYELEDGDYNFIVSANSHVDGYAYDVETVTIAQDSGLNFEKDPSYSDGIKIENLYTTGSYVNNVYTLTDFNDIQYRLNDVIVNGQARKGMSRYNFAATFPEPVGNRGVMTITVTNGEDEIEISERDELSNFATNNPIVNEEVETYELGKETDLTLRDMYGKSYDDEDWQKILDALTFDEMVDLVNNGAFQTSAILSIEKNLTNDSDGPIGFVNFLNNAYSDNTTFACEIVIGSTWNKDLAYRMGECVGDNGIWGAVKGNGLPYSGWYAPAVNLHRSPFSGRNFEYYSEDPILSGKLAVNVINGAMSKGVYCDLKHFALNDQETNRSGISTFCTEQALRELYLKPFEIAVKGNDNPNEVATAKAAEIEKFKGTTGVMSSFNRIGIRWTGGDYRLMTTILRDEWGFRGLVISDYKTSNAVMDSRQMVYAGNDLILVSVTSFMWNDAQEDNAHDVYVLRQAAHNILYTVANSNSVNVRVTGYQLEWWITLTIVVDCLAVVGFGVWGFFAIRKFVKSKKSEASEQ